MTNIYEELQKNGFYIFKNAIDVNTLDYYKQFMPDKNVNYGEMDKFIQQYMIDNISQSFNKKMVNMKYRISNNNNSADASAFHRDLHILNNNKFPVNVFTMLTYIDGGKMQLIPGTHLTPHIPIHKAYPVFNTSVTITLNPGDILIFVASIIHRGIFYLKQENRRLIQLFDTVFHDELNYYLQKIMHIPCRNECNESLSKKMIKYSKIKALNELLNFAAFFNTSIGYAQYNFIKNKNVNYFSTETNQKRISIVPYSLQEGNCYIVKIPGIDIDKKDFKMFYYLSFYLNYQLFMILEIIFIIIIVLIIRQIIKRIKN